METFNARDIARIFEARDIEPDGIFTAAAGTGWREPTKETTMNKIIHVDNRGHCLVAHADGTYSAGCHERLSRKKALAHWGDENYPSPVRGAAFVDAIERDEEISALPKGLRVLSLDFPLPEGIALPEGLEELYLFSPLPAGTTLPEGLERLHLYAPLPAGVALPEGLRVLYLRVHLTDGLALPAGTTLPEGLEELYLFSPLHDGVVLPEGLRVLYLDFPLPEGTVLPEGARVWRTAQGAA